MKVKLKNRSMLGQNIKKFIRKASNPQTIRPLQKYSINSLNNQSSQILKTPLTPFHNQSNQQFKKTIDQQYIKKNKFNFSSRLKMMLSKHQKTHSSRLFAEGDNCLLQTLDMKRDANRTQSSFARSIKHLKLPKKQTFNSHHEPQKKIKQLLEPQEPPSPVLQKAHMSPLKPPNKTNSYFYSTQRKSWHSVRVNNQVVIFDAEKQPRPKRSPNTTHKPSFYNTLYK